jgi:hypothetical protein
MCAGDETYGALKKVLGDMIRMGSLADTVTVPNSGTLDVRWHLCSVKHPAAKGCTDDGTLAIVPIYIPTLD